MPACPDCGLIFDSLYNIQLHRRSGACTETAKLLPKPAFMASNSPVYAGAGRGAGYHTPYPGYVYGAGGAGGGHVGRGNELMAAPLLTDAANPYMSPSERELEQLLAYQRSRQAADMAERERALLDQQVNLVLPARQAELQQSQQMLKSQLLQMKLQLFSNQQQQEKGADMDMAYLRNEIAAMRGALSSLTPRQAEEAESRQHQQRRGKPTRRPLTARSLPKRGAPKNMDATPSPRPDSYSGEGRPAFRNRWAEYRDNHNGDEDGPWSSLDDELRSDDSDDSDDGDDVSPRRRSRNTKPSQQICGMLQDVHEELRSLRAMSTSSRQGADAPFPTVSTLEQGLHQLKLAALEGIDMSIPLDEVDVSAKVYYMSYANGEYLLEPSIERQFPRRPSPLVRHDAKTLLFTVAPVEFMVHHPKEMVICMLQVLYRGRLLCWSTIFCKSCGSFTEGIRNSSFDLAKELQSPQNMVPNAVVSGYIEADSADSLRRAESILNQSIGSSAATGFKSGGSPAPQPSLPQLPGLPPLPPPPQGLPLLPGMPGCECAVLTPSVGASAMVMQPNQCPASRFVLPPPTGVSILEWQDTLAAHIKKVQKRPPRSTSAGDGAAAVKADKAPPQKAFPKSAPHPPPPRKAAPPAPPSSSSSEASGEDGENPPSESVSFVSVPPKPTAHFADEIVEQATPSPPPPAPLVKTIVEPPRPAPPPPPLMVKEAESPVSPPRQVHTPPPQKESNASLPGSDSPLSHRPPTGEKRGRMSPRSSLTPPITRSPRGSLTNKDFFPTSPSSSSLGGKVPREDMPQVELRRLRPAFDPQGNLAVPPGYKLNSKNPPSVSLDKFDIDAEPPVNLCVLLGLAHPTDKRPAQPKAPGHGAKESTVDVYFDGLTGLPLDAVCTRLLVYVTDEIDPASGKPMNPLHHPHVFMRKPDLVVYQSLSSSSAEPQFTGKLSAEVGDRTVAVVIVEFISSTQDSTLVFGHCGLPIHKNFVCGNFVGRIKLGDPRRSHERMVSDTRPAERVMEEQRRAIGKYDQKQLELSVDSQALHNLLHAPPRKRAECAPCGFLIWRLESSDMKAPFFEMPQQLPLSQAELAIFEGRRAHKDFTPSTKGISSPTKAASAFPDATTTPTDALGNVVPFSENRGVFVKVEGVRGVGDDAAMYVVVVFMPKAPKGRQVRYTMMPDWFSDVGTPAYKDPPFIFTGIKYDTTNTVMYMLLKLTNLSAAAEGPAKVEALGWTMNKLFLEPVNTMRQGRFALPWIAGGIPAGVVNELMTQKIDSVYMRMLKSGKIQFLTPHATLHISQGDSACIPSLVDVSPGRSQPRQLLTPAAMKKDYPISTCEGMVGCTLRSAHEKCFGGGDPSAFLQRINAAVQEYLRVTMPTLQEM